MKYNQLFVDKIRTGNVEAFQELYMDLFPRLSSFAYNFVKNKDISDDLVQDVFLKLWENRKDITIHSSIKAFLYTSVKNSSLNYIRKRNFDEAKFSEMQVLEMDALSEHYMLQEEVHSKLHKAINSLPEKCRQVMILTLREHSLSEIKEQMNITENTIKTHKKKAYSIIRQILNIFF